MIKRLILLIALILIGDYFISYSSNYEAMAQERMKFARQQTGDIEIAVVRHATDPTYLNGILLAAKQINQRPGKLIGRSIRIHAETGQPTIEKSMRTIRRIVSNPRIVAVLGHRRSNIAIPASVIYERSQVIFLPSFSTANSLTGHQFKYLFRMMPNTQILAGQQSSVANALGYQRIVILYARDSVSRELAFLFEDAAIKRGIKIIKRASFFRGEDKDYRAIISQFDLAAFDAIYIAADETTGARMAQQLREMGLSQPIIGSDSLAHDSYNQIAGVEAANRTIVPTIFKPNTHSQIQTTFIKQYQKEYGEPPNLKAAQGYDSLNLLATAIAQAESTLGPTLSSTLHYMPAWVGVTGIHAFDQDGELRGKKYFFQVWRDGKLVNLPGIHKFYLLDRFAKGLKAQHGENHPLTNFREVFKRRMHEDDHKTYRLDLAHELIRFKRIGIIYEDTESGRKQAHYYLLKELAKRKNIQMIECQVDLSLSDEKEKEKKLTECYGNLSVNIDALLTPSYYTSAHNPDFIQQLDAALSIYQIPSISIDQHSRTGDASIILNRSTDDISSNESHTMKNIRAYHGLLKNIKIHEFYDQITSLPNIKINLDDLQNDGIPDQPILDISTDVYLH